MLTVMTLNLNYLGDKHGDWTSRLPLIVRTVQEHNPDLIALQAVKKPGGSAGQAEQLSLCLPEHHNVVYLPACSRADGSAEGSGIVSRFPAQRVAFRRLSVAADAEDKTERIVIHTVFRLAGDSLLHCFNGHFSWIPAQTLSNVMETLEFTGSVPGNAILLGDFNSIPDTEAMHEIARHGWVDAWSTLKPGDSGWTFESDAPSIRIDYIWVREGMKDGLRDIRTVGPSGGAGPRLSDHLGLVAQVDYPAV